jgi:carboxypeptidase C (cathepsin A)
MGDAGSLLPPPYRLAANRESLLAHSDLVFVDPVSTGFSRVVTGEKPADYHGYQADVRYLAELIRVWISRNGRWMSPKFIIGESYGSVRAIALTAHLHRHHGIALNGLMLISAVLDYGTVRFTEGNDLPYVLFLPTYAALAHFHGRVGRPGRSGADVRAEAEEFAVRDYAYALARGARLTAAERTAVRDRLAALTGLGTDYLERANLRVEYRRFFRELLRDRGLVIGRLDGRFTGHEPDGVAEVPSHGPSMVALHGPYAAGINHYVRDELGYRSELPYELLTDRVHPWDFGEFEGKHVAVTDRLGTALRHNPHLRVLVASGHYDAATPYFATEHALHHIPLPGSLRRNIDLRYYGAGHMMYVHEPSRIAQARDFADFVRGASSQP